MIKREIIIFFKHLLEEHWKEPSQGDTIILVSEIEKFIHIRYLKIYLKIELNLDDIKNLSNAI